MTEFTKEFIFANPLGSEGDLSLISSGIVCFKSSSKDSTSMEANILFVSSSLGPMCRNTNSS